MLNSNSEIWKPMVGFDGRYEVSNIGRIRSIKSNHGKYQEKIKSTRIRSDTCQYLYVQLSVMDKPFHEAVHRAVAKAFLANPDNKPMVNHIDGNKLNNNVYNLEWTTCSENLTHAIATGLKDVQYLTDRLIGQKYGNTSKYHNVSWDSTRGLWKATLKDKGKMVFQKRFKCEHIAAKYVNEKLDELGYSNRPRNTIT